MRLALLANAFKRLGVQGLGRSVCQQRSPYDESRTVFPLFFKTFSSAESAPIEDMEKPLKESRRKSVPMVLYRRISDNSRETQSALEGWVNDGKKLKRNDLQGLVRGLRHFGKYKKALEVLEWMQNHPKFVLAPGDCCLQLDLITKVYGIDRAEKYFQDLSEFAKNEITYRALLNCYARKGLIEKAENWMEKMQELGFTMTVDHYNPVMTCYLASGQADKVILTIKHLKKMDVQINSYTYRLWINACAAMSSIDDAEKIVDELKSTNDDSVIWTAYIALGNMYIKGGLLDKAKSAMKEAEKKIAKGERKAYDYLITMNTSIGDKEEVYRIWNSLKTSFDKLNNDNYLSMLSSLAKFGDIEGAEKIFEEWESSRSDYDFRACNILLAAYVRGGMLEKAESFHSRIIRERGEPICKTWEILAEGYLNSKQMDKAVITMMKALSSLRSRKWKPRSENVVGILKYLEEQGDVGIADSVLKFLRDIHFVTTEIYNLLLSTRAKAGMGADDIFEQMVIDKVSADVETDRLRKVINDNTPSGQMPAII